MKKMNRITIAVLIDAFGWEVLGEHPFLPELVHRKPLRTILGFSSGAIPSLLSGALPNEHGRWFLYRRSRSESPFGFARLLAPFAGGGRVGRKVRWAYENCFDFFTDNTGYYHLYQVPLPLLPEFDLPETKPIYEPGGLETGETLFDRIERRGIPHRVWYWRTPEQRNFDELHDAVRGREAPFLFFYASELDALMHARGTCHPDTARLIGRYEEQIRVVVAEAEWRYDEVELIICSDHGMVNVNRTIDLMTRVRALPFREGRDYLPFYDSTFARFWFHDERAEAAIGELLAGTEGGRLVDDEELGRLGVLFPEGEYGDVVFVADAGTVIAPSFMGNAAPAGMHGYHPDDRGSDGIVLSNRPVPDETGSILDMASLLEGAAVRAWEGESDGEPR